MRSHRAAEGAILLDHRNNEGVPDEIMVAQGLPAGAGRGLFEAATYNCSHCQFTVVINPLRNRDRAYCAKCDHLICDECGARKAAGADCVPWKKVVDDALEAATQAQQRSIILSV